MAAGTIGAETAAVFVFGGVAGNAARRGFIFSGRRPQMAGRAGKRFMRAGKGKARILRMVEPHPGPVDGSVTGRAVGAEAPVVTIIFAMAINAFC